MSNPKDSSAEFVLQTTGLEPSWHTEAMTRHLAAGTLSVCLGPAALLAMRRAEKLEHALATFAGFAQQACQAQLPFLEWLKRLRCMVIDAGKRGPKTAHQCLCDLVNEHNRVWREIYSHDS